MVYRTWSNVLSAAFATLAGALLALWLRYVGPDTTLSFEIMLDILLIVVIGGMGTLYGAIVGSVLFVLAQNYLQDLLKLAHEIAANAPLSIQAAKHTVNARVLIRSILLAPLGVVISIVFLGILLTSKKAGKH